MNETVLKNIEIAKKYYETWKKNTITEYTKDIRATIVELAKKHNNVLILNGDLAYSAIMDPEKIEDAFFAKEKLTFFIKNSGVRAVFAESHFKGMRVIFSDILIDDHSREIYYYVKHSGFTDPMRLTVAKMFIIPDDYAIAHNTIAGISVISPDYLFIDWYTKVSQPRELESLAQWQDIHDKNDQLLQKVVSQYHNHSGLKSVERISKLEKYFQNNKNIILCGDFAISMLVKNTPFRRYKILVVGAINDTRDAIAKILAPFGYRYTFDNNFIMHYHGPRYTFTNKATQKTILEFFISNEQCIPAYTHDGYQIARVPNLLKYLFIENQSKDRDAIIKKIIDSMNEYFAENKKTPFDDTPFQIYDVNCVGEYTSLLRKKRIKIYKAKLK
jgi:hypothetical protein